MTNKKNIAYIDIYDQGSSSSDIELECSNEQHVRREEEEDAVFAMRQNQAKIILRDRLLRLGVADADINLEGK